jgi:hypothetical protein
VVAEGGVGALRVCQPGLDLGVVAGQGGQPGDGSGVGVGIVRQQRLGRGDPGQLLSQPRRGVLPGPLDDAPLAGADVDPGAADPLAAPSDRGQVAALARRQQGGVGDGAGRENAGHLAPDQPLADRPDLLGDGDGVAVGQEAAEVAGQGVVRDAGHRHPPGTAEGAGGEGDPGIAGEGPGVLVEGLVEVAEAVEEEGAGVPRLEVEVLPAGGDEVGGGSGVERVGRDGLVHGLARVGRRGIARGARGGRGHGRSVRWTGKGLGCRRSLAGDSRLGFGLG